MAVFVDFDGTITDADTFDVLARSAIGDREWDELDAQLHNGEITLREILARQAAYVRLSREAALELLAERVRIDASFSSFVRTARARGASVCVVSSGLRAVIEHALERIGIAVDVLANEVHFDEAGWRLAFRDESENGHDKAAHVRRARAAGARTVFIGDGISDYEAALAADLRFAKRGRRLERHCEEQGVACASFDTFAQIERALFP